jgi:hypothetical protein
MRFVENYWWLLILPVAIYLWVRSTRQISRAQWVWVLRISGTMLLLASAVWLITGDVENQYISLHIGGGWWGVTIATVAGVLALIGAHRLAEKPAPPA